MNYLNESRKRLKEIEEEQRRGKFLRWASSNVGCLRELNSNELEALRYHYENAESWRKVVDSTFDMAINQLNGDINHNNDLETRRKQADIALEKLNDYVKFLEQRYGITNTEVKQNDNLKR